MYIRLWSDYPQGRPHVTGFGENGKPKNIFYHLHTNGNFG